MKYTPYWLDTSPAGPDRSGTEVGGDVDVAVVGAGLTGVSAALHLARKGAKVAVFERETVAWGASGRNGGMATPGLAIGFRDAIARYGFPTASTLYLTYYDAIDTIEKLVGEEGIDCDFARTGKMNLASKPAHLDGLRKTHDVLAERLGYETQMVSKSELHTEIGSDSYHGAMIDPKGAGLHVGKFTRGLAESAARTGVQIHEKAPVQSVERLGGTRHEVITPRGSVRADQVLVATSGYTSRPFRWLQLRIVPVGSFIIVTEPLGKEVCDQLLPNRRMASDSKNLLYYFRITPDHRLLFGGRARFAMSDPKTDEKSGRILQQGDALGLPAAGRGEGGLLLGRPGRHDPGPAGARRRARRSLLLGRLLRARRADGDVHGQADGGVHERRARGQPVARHHLQADPRSCRPAVVPAVRRRLLQVPGHHPMNCRP